MARVGILGLGAVGTAVCSGMGRYHSTGTYDSDGRGSLTDILNTAAVFICVPTNGLEGGSLDLSAVESASSKLYEVDYRGLVIVKSTLHPGSMEVLTKRYRNLRLVYMPEFLRERDAAAWFLEPDRIVVSGLDSDVDEALDLFKWVPEYVPRLRMTHGEAEIAKLAHNAYIATKVTFTCEIERICELNAVDVSKVMEVVWRDKRVGNSAHLSPGLGGFGGKCVPKDTRSLRQIDSQPDDQSLLAFILRYGTDEAVRSRRKVVLE